MSIKGVSIVIGSIAVVMLATAGIYFAFFRSTNTLSTEGTSTAGFTGDIPNSGNTAPATTDSNGTVAVNTTAASESQKIFKISEGPVVGATLIQTLRPTTTVARYIRQDDGHVFDIPLGVAGAVPKVVSNVTIPGGQRAMWLEGGNAAIMQYIDNTMIVKTVYLGFPAATTSRATLPTKLAFLPDNIVDIAVSPDGKSVGYIIKTAQGSDLYTAKSDGSAAKKLSSLPLSQLVLSWPANNTLIAQSKSAAGVAGIAFSISLNTGTAVQLVSGNGISVNANPTFALLLYQITDAAGITTYLHDIATGDNAQLAVSALPEQCIWSKNNSLIAYCATPKDAVDPTYPDYWHMGLQTAANAIVKVLAATADISPVVIPGSRDGGINSDILEMALSPDEKYLSYTTKGGRELYGVLLGN